MDIKNQFLAFRLTIYKISIANSLVRCKMIPCNVMRVVAGPRNPGKVLKDVGMIIRGDENRFLQVQSYFYIKKFFHLFYIIR